MEPRKHPLLWTGHDARSRTILAAQPAVDIVDRGAVGFRAMKFDATLLTALTGGLAGAVATLIGQALLRWWSRPLLGFRFASDEPGCEVDPGEWHRYLRLKIENGGRSVAHNVSVCVIGIEYRDGARQKALKEEVYDLKVAFTEDRTTFNLASKGHRFVDLVHTEGPDNEVRHYLEFVVGSSRRNEL